MGRLGVLLERYRNYLSLLARVQIGRRIQGKLDVADVVQEAFLEVHRGIGRFRGGSEAQFLAWLRQILGGILANQVAPLLRYQATGHPAGTGATG